MIVFPNCKINLGLHILRKRPDGFHDLETVFYPIPLRDALEVLPATENATTFTASGLPLNISADDNICLRAYRLLRTDFPQLPFLNIHLHKHIPSGAGLGGGSSNASFMLLLLNNRFALGLSEDQLVDYALLLGSDCPFFIRNRPSLARGRGEILEDAEVDLSAYKIVLINPGIHINTGWAFSRIVPKDGRPSLKNALQLPVQDWKNVLTNDFEEAVFSEYPTIKEIKEDFYRLGAAYASLSGSGSTVFGLFPSLPSDNSLSSFLTRFPTHHLL